MKRYTAKLSLLLSCILLISSCSKAEGNSSALQMYSLNNEEIIEIDDNYRTTYEICPYSFYDTNNDGIGDINGINEKLDYIVDQMGFNQIWITPVTAGSSYHKYDVIDYYNIDSDFGTLDDYINLINNAHDKNCHIIFDLVINHTSINHPWFIQASNYLQSLNGKQADINDCKYLDYYNFSLEKKSGYEKLENSDYYYEARFTGSMPDLNLDSDNVRKEIEDIVTYWLNIGVDGFRLDAVTSYYTDSRSDTISFLTWLCDTIKSINNSAYIVGEAWTTSDAIADYYTSGIDSLFNFEFANTNGVIAKVVKGSSASYYGSMTEYCQQLFLDANANYIDAPFYTNHDMARSAGYYNGDYALAQTKLAGALNLLSSGTAFVYYGEEIGMKGSKDDPSKRLPMRWGDDVTGVCDNPPGSTAVKNIYDTLDKQIDDPLSILNYYQQAIKIRNMYPAISRGYGNFIDELSDDNICVIEKVSEIYDNVLIVINTSDQGQEVDLSSLNYTNLCATLNVDENKVELKDNILIVPPYNIGILK